jgi:hypothetical protein
MVCLPGIVLRPSEGLENTQPLPSGLEWPIFQVFAGIFATIPLFEAGHGILNYAG